MSAAEKPSHAEKASAFFKEGYNCAQSVVLAFADDLEIDRETLLMMASPFGGGLGRLREVCGCVCGMALVVGALKGYSDPKARTEKADLYALIQELAAEYKEENGSYICRELLGKALGTDSSAVDTAPQPEARTPEYYKKRPCARLAASAAGIVERRLKL